MSNYMKNNAKNLNYNLLFIILKYKCEIKNILKLIPSNMK